METDVYSEATSAILSFVNAEGMFKVEGSTLTIISFEMDNEKVDQLKNIIFNPVLRELGKVPPAAYTTNENGDYYKIKFEAPSIEALRNFLMTLMPRLKAE